MQSLSTANTFSSQKFSCATKAYPVKFVPVPQERIWGGHRLKAWYGVGQPNPVGEYWLVSSYPGAETVVRDGPMKGASLAELTARMPESYLGTSPQQRFPLLIKMIEAEDDLSVQVHPDDHYAGRKEQDWGKTECWYIVDSRGGGTIVYGHRYRDKAQFIRSVQEQTVTDYLRHVRVQKDDLVFVPSGTLHAIMKGTILLEIQQTSDVTYRVYDWDRLDANGCGRTLHVEQAAEVMQFEQRDLAYEPVRIEPEAQPVSLKRLVSCPYFTVDRLDMKAFSEYTAAQGREGNPDVLIVLEGECCLKHSGQRLMSIRRGEAVLVPAEWKQYQLAALQDVKLIRTFY